MRMQSCEKGVIIGKNEAEEHSAAALNREINIEKEKKRC
jgi:hypothetical protein